MATIIAITAIAATCGTLFLVALVLLVAWRCHRAKKRQVYLKCSEGESSHSGVSHVKNADYHSGIVVNKTGQAIADTV